MLPIVLVYCAIGMVSPSPVFDDITPRPGEKCGYESCIRTDPGVLNVHIVPHSHDDVGWLKTVDQYYYGSRNDINKAGVQYIIDSVIKELWDNPKRRFIYVETAFLWKWWVQQSPRVKRKVHTLVRQGRLQFVGGAWSMNDEAASHYQSIIDQFTWGLSKLNETFGPCALPRVGWQVDPFGHSREFASLVASMGYDGLFLGRIDYQDKENRFKQKTMEMVWRGDDDLGKASDIFTGVLYNTYSPPPGFCFDVLCDDEPIIDDPNSPIYNVDARVLDFIKICKNMSGVYKTNNILITMGEDFQYQDAAMWYTNLDKLIAYTNLKAAKDGLNIKLFYSTPNCYLKAVKDANPTLPTKQDDFFPYSSDSRTFWTGYFTSRPTTKYFEREGNDYLQMAKQVQVLAGLQEHNVFMLNELKSALGVMQHHDAITGTEKEHVTHDYERMLHAAIEDSLVIPRQGLNKLMQGDALKPPLFAYERCKFNESSCHTTETASQFVVTVYNPLAWAVNESVRIPIVDGKYEVIAPNSEVIDSQIVSIPASVRDIPTRVSMATHEIVFMAYLHPLGYKTYYIRRTAKTRRELPKKKRGHFEVFGQKMEYNLIKNNEVPLDPVFGKFRDGQNQVGDEVGRVKYIGDRQRTVPNLYPGLSDEEMRMLSDEPMFVERYDDDVVMVNEHIAMHIDNALGSVKKIVMNDGTQANLNINMFYYPGCVGDNMGPTHRSSGAYILRPNATQPIALTKGDIEHIEGVVVKEVRLKWAENAYSVARLYQGQNFVEHEWVVGPIDITDNIGKEYIVRYETNILNNGEFFTDSNGRQVLKRKLDKRPQWNVSLAEPIPGNYYPITNEIYIVDGNTKFAVLTDRAQGGTSLVEGNVELMLHRRLLHDDAFGVGEALNETANNKGLVVRGRHRLMLTDDDVAIRKNILQLHLQPIVFVSDAKDVSLEQWLTLRKSYSWLKTSLPKGVHLLTLEPWGEKLLLRLENYLSKEDADNIVEVDLTSILKNVNIKNFKETILSANQWMEDYKQWTWNKEGQFSANFNKEYGSFEPVKNAEDSDFVEEDNGFKVKLGAKQIRTFIVDYDFVEN